MVCSYSTRVSRRLRTRPFFATSARSAVRSDWDKLDRNGPASAWPGCGFFFRRHLPVAHPLEDPLPGFEVCRIGWFKFQVRQIQVRLADIPVVTIEAMLLEQRIFAAWKGGRVDVGETTARPAAWVDTAVRLNETARKESRSIADAARAVAQRAGVRDGTIFSPEAVIRDPTDALR